MGPVDGRKLAGHSTSPGIVDWNGDKVPDLLAGAEDGFFYYLENPRPAKNKFIAGAVFGLFMKSS